MKIRWKNIRKRTLDILGKSINANARLCLGSQDASSLTLNIRRQGFCRGFRTKQSHQDIQRTLYYGMDGIFSEEGRKRTKLSSNSKYFSFYPPVQPCLLGGCMWVEGINVNWSCICQALEAVCCFLYLVVAGALRGEQEGILSSSRELTCCDRAHTAPWWRPKSLFHLRETGGAS